MYQFSVPVCVVWQRRASSCSVAWMPKCRSIVAAHAGPHVEAVVWQQTSPDQESRKFSICSGRTTSLRYGRQTASTSTAALKPIRSGRCVRTTPAVTPKPTPIPAAKSSDPSQERTSSRSLQSWKRST